MFKRFDVTADLILDLNYFVKRFLGCFRLLTEPSGLFKDLWAALGNFSIFFYGLSSLLRLKISGLFLGLMIWVFPLLALLRLTFPFLQN